jgi:predicted metalloprotease
MAPQTLLNHALLPALTAVALLTVSCGQITTAAGSERPDSAQTAIARDAAAAGTSGGGSEPVAASDCSALDGKTFAGDVTLARCLTERFWARKFADSGATYQPVRQFISYEGENGPDCGNEKAVPNNAFYCPAGHFIAYDATWLKSLYDQLGDGAVYVIIPHEFGHAVQAQTVNNFSYNIERELQADCYAGGTISALINGKALKAEEGDGEELLTNLAAAGDPTDAWWAPDAHGTPAQRQASFAKGFQRGVAAC